MSGVELLTGQLWFVAVPGRKPIAEGLVAAGWRHHPDLATKHLVREPGTERMGNWATQRLESLHTPGAELLAPPTGVSEIQVSEQLAALAATLGFLTPEARASIAAVFRDLGWRCEPASAPPSDQSPPDGPTGLGALRKAATRVPGLAALADRIEQAAAAAAAGDTSARDALGAELIAGFHRDSGELERRRAAGDMEPATLEPDEDQ